MQGEGCTHTHTHTHTHTRTLVEAAKKKKESEVQEKTCQSRGERLVLELYYMMEGKEWQYCTAANVKNVE